MPSRPAIPAEVTREILLESGHRCAVCGTSCPLERAHIIPWHKSREHKAEDLICLCANCHERADKEKWGERTLRCYKKRPWVLRQYESTNSTPELETAKAYVLDASTIANIERLVQEDQLAEALQRLYGIESYRSEATLQTQRLSRINRQERQGIITRGEAAAERTRIADAILGLIADKA